MESAIKGKILCTPWNWALDVPVLYQQRIHSARTTEKPPPPLNNYKHITVEHNFSFKSHINGIKAAETAGDAMFAPNHQVQKYQSWILQTESYWVMLILLCGLSPNNNFERLWTSVRVKFRIAYMKYVETRSRMNEASEYISQQFNFPPPLHWGNHTIYSCYGRDKS